MRGAWGQAKGEMLSAGLTRDRAPGSGKRGQRAGPPVDNEGFVVLPAPEPRFAGR